MADADIVDRLEDLQGAIAEIIALRAALRECADDLAVELNERYPPEMRAYPGNERQYQRDMEPVRRARELLSR